jgi:hypothetical protein
MSTELSPEEQERRIVKNIQTAAMFLDEHIKETAQGFVCEFKVKDFQDIPKQLQEITFFLTQFDGGGKRRVADIQSLYPSYVPQKLFLVAFIKATSINENKTVAPVIILKLMKLFSWITEQMTTPDNPTEDTLIFTGDGPEVKKYIGEVMRRLKILEGTLMKHIEDV